LILRRLSLSHSFIIIVTVIIIILGSCSQMSQDLWYSAFFSLFIYSHVHTLFGPFPPLPPFPHHPLASRQNLFCPFLQFYWRVDMSNKKDKPFLEVEMRIALKRDSQHCFNAQVYYNLNWVISTRPLYYFLVTFPYRPGLFYGIVLAPLQWGHQTLSSFVFPIYPHSSCMCSLLNPWPKSKNITAFALDLKTAYEGKHNFLSSEAG
jgi:hypothetical protein